MFSGGFTVGAQGEQPGGSADARVRAFGPRPLTGDDSVKSGTTVTVNANVGYRTPRWEAVLECLNLADRKDNDIGYFYTSRLGVRWQAERDTALASRV